MTAEAAIAESINQFRDEILYYARLHFAMESPLDIQTLANWARLYIADQEEQTLTTLNLNGSFETRELECTPGVTYNLPAVPDAVISHIQVISSRLSEIRLKAFLCLSMAHFRLWQADEDLTRSNFLHALQSFQSAVFNLSEGMSTLGIEWDGSLSRLIRSNTARKGGIATAENTGSRRRRTMIREIWSSGKYTARDVCAEQECGALGMSFSAARKALRNTPEPNPWPAMNG